MSSTLEARDLYAAEFDRIRRARPDRPAWLDELCRRGMDRFSALGFPTTRDEDWRFTSVAPIAGRPFAPARHASAGVARDQASGFVVGEASQPPATLVFVNGRHAPELSNAVGLPSGTYVGTLDRMIEREPDLVQHHLGRHASVDDRAFAALNTALLEDGAVVRVPAKAIVEQPIQLVFLTAPGGEAIATHPRVLVLAGPGSQVTLTETYASPTADVYFTNAVTEIVAGENAVVDHYKVVRESIESFHVASMHVHLGRSANFASHAITLGGRLVRNDALATLDGEGIECTLNGLYLVDGDRLVDNHTTIDHAKPHCNSHEIYKGILDGKGRGVFNGKIIVRQDAQKTDAKQTNKALLLSEDGQINTKPQLEIFADDVKCTHGATVGQLDAAQLFYLQARGIGRDAARQMLIHAFASDVLTGVSVQALRDELERALIARLPGGEASRGLR